MKSIVAVVGIAIVAAGCAGPGTGSRTGGMELSQSIGSDATVCVDDRFFSRNVEVVESAILRAEAGFPVAQARIRSNRSRDFALQYKFTWFDSDGFEVQQGSRPWEQVVIHGGETVSLSASAPDVSVVKFILRFRGVQ